MKIHYRCKLTKTAPARIVSPLDHREWLHLDWNSNPFPRRIKMLSIKILGSGCTNCKRLEQITRKMVESMALKAEIIKVTDYADIMSYDILSTPGLVINEKVVSNGRIPSEGEISTFLVNAMVGV